MPAYDEHATIEAILERVAQAPYDKEIIVVDDASTDGTREFLEGVARGETRFTDGAGHPVALRVVFQGA